MNININIKYPISREIISNGLFLLFCSAIRLTFNTTQLQQQNILISFGGFIGLRFTCRYLIFAYSSIMSIVKMCRGSVKYRDVMHRPLITTNLIIGRISKILLPRRHRLNNVVRLPNIPTPYIA